MPGDNNIARPWDTCMLALEEHLGPLRLQRYRHPAAPTAPVESRDNKLWAWNASLEAPGTQPPLASVLKGWSASVGRTTLMVSRRSSREALAGSVTDWRAAWRACCSSCGCLLLSVASSSLGPASGLLNRADAAPSAPERHLSRARRDLSCLFKSRLVSCLCQQRSCVISVAPCSQHGTLRFCSN